jgi:sugar transferase (PEP-CTERM system associated)
MRRIFGHYVATSWLLLGVLEASLIAAGCWAAFYYFFPGQVSSTVAVTSFAVVLSCGIVALMHSGGLYEGATVLRLRGVLWRTAVVTAPVFALAAWTVAEVADHSRVPLDPYRWQMTATLTSFWLLSGVGLRVVFRQMQRSGFFTRRIVVVGMQNHAAELASLAVESDRRFRLVGQIDPRNQGDISDPEFRLAAQASNLRASEIVIAINGERLPWDALAQCKFSGIRVTDYLDFCEREGRRICVDNLREDWIALSRGFEVSKPKDRLRRIVDIVLSAVGFVAAAPVLILSALAIKLEDGGSVFYRQERTGLGGRPFTLFKFRSMRENAESDGCPAWATERDMRITMVGRFIRTLRIDELPQLWNVLLGDMTIVGPRPERPHFVDQFSKSIPFYSFRHAVRPGITGWAQVSFRYGASLEDARRKLSYDLYYIKNRSFVLDLIILFKTVNVVLTGQGAR